MRKFKNAAETLDALEEELQRMKKDAARLKVEFVPCPLVVALYRLSETQLSETQLLISVSWSCRYNEEYDRDRARFDEQSRIGAWIAEQPE